MSSPLVTYYRALELEMSKTNELSAGITHEKRKAMLRGLFTSYYPGDKAVFDTNRGWMAKVPALAQLFPDFKMICCVRDIAWIMDSFERLHTRNPLEPSKTYGFDVKGNVFNRMGSLQSPDGVVGWSLNALREVMAGEHRHRIHLVEYHQLCQTPKNTMKAIYDFLGEERFIHNFESVEYSAHAVDHAMGADGMHEISGPVKWEPRDSILPPVLFHSYGDCNFWRDLP